MSGCLSMCSFSFLIVSVLICVSLNFCLVSLSKPRGYSRQQVLLRTCPSYQRRAEGGDGHCPFALIDQPFTSQGEKLPKANLQLFKFCSVSDMPNATYATISVKPTSTQL